MKINKEIKTAALVIGGILLFIYGFSYLKGKSIFKDTKTLYTVYDEVEGLIPGAKVTINGLSIGKISNIDFLPSTTKILVTMDVRKELNFSTESAAMLYEVGLIGGKAISIVPKFDNNKTIQSGDTLRSEIKPSFTDLINRQIEPLQIKIESMLTSADSLFVGVSNVLDSDTQANLKNTLENLSVTMENLNNASLAAHNILAQNQEQLNATFVNIKDTSENLKSITDSISSAEISRSINQFSKTVAGLNTIVSAIDAGEGTAGKLIRDEALYDNLRAATKELELLMRDLKNHPKRYVHFSLFGKKDKPYIPEEN
ncbi:MAG: MlaD family protein [Flavobacteriaceae bacterium]|nr:MlaD family protein [Flavobacteriaceae bacterium]